MASDPAAARPRRAEEAREHLARCALAWLLAERNSADLDCPFTLPEAAEALDLAARDLTDAVDAEPPLRRPKEWDR